MRCHSSLLVAALASAALLAPAARVQAQAPEAPTGVTMTPDQRHLLVNKQLGAERWTISVNLVPEGEGGGGPRVASITGNVFRPDTDEVSFLYCQVEPGSTGSLAEPESVLGLRCKGAGPCAGGAPPCEDRESCGALACARHGWTLVAGGIEIPAGFFLPPEGLSGGAPEPEAAAHAARWGDDVTRLLSDAARWLADRAGAALPGEASAQSIPLAAATLSIDQLHHLVVRDRSGQRWSIVLHMEPDPLRAGGFRIATVTGNVYTETQAPSFVFCEPTAGSARTVERPGANLVFACQGATACATSAVACAQADWVAISEPIMLEASFFLPDGGRGSPPTSNRRMHVFGPEDRLPSIASREFHLPTDHSGKPTTCDDGAPCIVSRIGLCEEVAGRQLTIGDECYCYVDPVTPYCVRCGTEDGARIPAACGEPCAFDVGKPLENGERTGILVQARGVCLPLDADSPHCFCHAIESRRTRSVQVCGGVEAAGCATAGCCIDDPRDGCRPLDGDVSCPGMCVGAVDGAPADGACGIRTAAAQTCGDGVVTGSELCDPADPAASALSCATLGLAGGSAACVGCKVEGCGGSGSAPVLELLSPDLLPRYGRAPIRARWQDADGDVVALVLTVGDGSERRWSIPDAAGRASGEFEFSVGCNEDATRVDFQVHLVDAAGNESAREPLDVPCDQDTRLCGDGVQAESEACDSSVEGGSGCPAGTLCANDCSACNPADSCRGRCCPAAGTFCAPAEQACACDPGCALRNDCCADSRQECGF